MFRLTGDQQIKSEPNVVTMGKQTVHAQGSL